MSPVAPISTTISKVLKCTADLLFFTQVIEKVVTAWTFLDLIFMNNRKLTEIVGSNYTSKKLEMTKFTWFSMGKGRTGTQKGSIFKNTAEKTKLLCIQDYNQIKSTR